MSIGQETLLHLKEQIGFLKTSAKLFDEGNVSEGKRLALTIRILVHDTNKSKSLIEQMGIKQKIKFLNTALPKPLAPAGAKMVFLQYYSLVLMRLANDGCYYKSLQAIPEVTAKATCESDFNSWWDQIVIFHSEKISFSRRDVILFVANKDGGAHIDSKLPTDYSELSRGDYFGMCYVKDGETTSIIDIHLHTIRQIAEELMRTLEKYLNTQPIGQPDAA